MIRVQPRFGLQFLLALISVTTSQAAEPLGQLEQQLRSADPAQLAATALADGDAIRGAILFHQPHVTCTQCHTAGGGDVALGPDLARPDPSVQVDAGRHVVESLLKPSAVVRGGYQAVQIVTTDGRRLTGLLAAQGKEAVVLRDAALRGDSITIPVPSIEEQQPLVTSIMPEGLVNQLNSRQQFLDLVRYLIEIRREGPQRALQLRPDPALYAAPPLPEYEQDIDHAGFIREWSDQSFQRGQAIYNRLCINCHGTHTAPGSLPTSLRFAEGKFKNGSDPFRMYQTLTHGFGQMVAQRWMVPQQKYDVIHYIRAAYLKEHNASQYEAVNEAYLTGLPAGGSRGPDPITTEPWVTMNYGPSLIHTYEAGSGAVNIAQKGIAVRLDPGAGGVTRGAAWMLYDADTLRVAAAWTGQGFIDFNGIMFNGRHGIHPRLVGDLQLVNPTGPGWAGPGDRGFVDPRLRGRDDRAYGPLPRDWAHYQGLYHHELRTLVEYTVGAARVVELPGVDLAHAAPVFTRTFNIGPRARPLVLQVAYDKRGGAEVQQIRDVARDQAVLFGPALSEGIDPAPRGVRFDGQRCVRVAGSDDFDMTAGDYSIWARIRTTQGGSLFSKAADSGPWVTDGKTLFVHDGRLVFDIGWVGEVRSERRVDDGAWHDVAMTWRQESGEVHLYIDGERDSTDSLRPQRPVAGHVVRLGYTSPDFPDDGSYFRGELAELRFYSRALSADELSAAADGPRSATGLLARWLPPSAAAGALADTTKQGHQGAVISASDEPSGQRQLVVGCLPAQPDLHWDSTGGCNLRLHIPAGSEALRFTLWFAQAAGAVQAAEIATAVSIEQPDRDLSEWQRGGPPRWPQPLQTAAVLGDRGGPFAVDVLTRPAHNPWLCQVRLTGLDFYPGGDRAAICSWDGDVWTVEGLNAPQEGLTWRRIASGLFQPLGLRIIAGKIHLTCRDQLCILHDLNGDGETDYYQNFNNDHQVTEHFHEFAMGLQTDDEGNFYYAKSARHALTAVVPHHGTLLRVSRDGSRTDIVATGFRAANGVCLNPDGSFIVTDQEGHWNPKNRINWVRPGGFYGNMFGYHDVTDSSDKAMDQPLCWITNAFDRSPAELLWVKSDAWGPLDGSLLNISYGYGRVYVVPHEELKGQMQGGMCALPIADFPTGTIRGRFHPTNGQLYLCGMFSWAGSRTQPGGFYRIVSTGQPMHLPIGLQARKSGMQITFSDELAEATATDPSNYAVKIWSLRRTANYGSQHFDERSLQVTAATLSPDRRTVKLTIPDIRPTWCMEIKCQLQGANGEDVNRVIHNTIHGLAAD